MRKYRLVRIAIGLGVLVLSGTQGFAADSGNDALMILLDQNRALQAEVQALRAAVEEQGFEIRRLQRESLDRYTDVDNRLGALEQGLGRGDSATEDADVTGGSPIQSGGGGISSASPVETPVAAQTLPARSPVTGSSPAVDGNSPVSGMPAGSAPRPSLPAVVMSEQELYQKAYESAINSQFEQAVAEFDQYLASYPEGRFNTNAHYWKGQSYLYLSRYAEAVAAYELILERYPDAPKVPDAMYGLGVAYEGMGNLGRARQLMQEIKRRFPNTGVANLADTRLMSLQ